MIESQKQMQSSQFIGMPSYLPPPTPFFNHPMYDPYMGYYPMPSHSYNLPPPTPLLDMPQQQQIEQKPNITSQQQPLNQDQMSQISNNQQNNYRNASISSFKELELEVARINHNDDIIEPKRERLTPLFHQRPHTKAIFGLNTMIQIKANDPCEGQPALVEIHNLYDEIEHYLTNDPDYKILQEFPGPLIK